MEKILTNCLIKMRDDLSQLRHIKECLDSNPDSQYQNGGSSISWRTIEAFNISLAACKEKEMQELDVLSTILDSFYYISSHNNEDSIWENFGFDLGLICEKFLSLIEQTERFEELFCKLLSTVDIICQHTSDTWKAIGRQILNVFINKKLSIGSLETGLQLYICILRKIDISVLSDFALQNFHLINTFFKTARRAGDIEIQTFIAEAAFLHVHKNTKLLKNFILELESEVKQSFQNLNLVNFKDKCRLYLNILNNLESDKKVYSLNCKKIVLGDCVLEPQYGKNFFWLDANDSTERISIRCLDFQKKSSHDFLVLIKFSSIIHIHIEQQPENIFKIIFNLEKLNEVLSFAKTNHMICTTTAKQNLYKDIVAFKNFVEKHANKTNSNNDKLSQNINFASIVKNVSCNRNDNHNDNQKKFGINRIVPDALTLLHKMKNENVYQQTTIEKTLKSNKNNTENDQNKPPDFSFEKEKQIGKLLTSPKCDSHLNTIEESQELSPNSFIESLNKNLGLDTPTISSSYEGSLIPVSFEVKSPDQNSHSLFQESNIIFEFPDRKFQQIDFNCLHEMSKKEQPNEKNDFSNSTKSNTRRRINLSPYTPSKKKLELSDTQSDIYFYSQGNEKRKPRMPRLKNIIGKNNKKKSKVIKDQIKQQSKPKSNHQTDDKNSKKPSLLDPNGYAYKKWLEPTTSARSKFWLKKIEQLEEKKKKQIETFEFTDESDLEWKFTSKKAKFSKGIKRGRKKKQQNLKTEPGKNDKNPKRKDRSVKVQKKTKPNEFKTKMKLVNSPISENLKTKLEQESTLKEINYTKKVNAEDSTTSVTNIQCPENSSKEASENYIEDSLKSCKEKFQQINQVAATEQVFDVESIDSMLPSNKSLIIKKSSSFESLKNQSKKTKENGEKNYITNKKQRKIESESKSLHSDNDDIELSEIEKDLFDSQKRKFELEGTFTNNDPIAKKKLKRKSNKSLTPILKNRIEKFQTKIKKETDEIINTFATATFRLVNYIQKKNVHNLISYMKKAQQTTFDLDSCDLEDEIEKIGKVYVYYKNKCSGSEMFDSILAHLSSAKNAVECWSKTKNMVWSKIKNYNNKLEKLINNEIDEMIKRETESFKHKVMQYAFFFNEDSDDWIDRSILQD